MRRFFWVLVMLNAVPLLWFGIEVASDLARMGTAGDHYVLVFAVTALINCAFFLAAVRAWRRWPPLTEALAKAAALLANLAQACAVLLAAWETQMLTDLFADFFRQPDEISLEAVFIVVVGAAFTIPNFIGLWLRHSSFANKRVSGETARDTSESI